MKFAVGCQILIYWRRDHETLDCTASMESENTIKKFTSHFLKLHLMPQFQQNMYLLHIDL